MSNNKQTPYKLFTRDGKFITTIGAYGQGPNEYGNTYADQLDEAHNRIYILPRQSDKLLVFDLQGNPQPPIPLCMRVPKGKFRVDTEKSEVTLTTLPFEGWPAVVWTQDFKGKRKNFIAPGHLTVPRDFSNEVFMDNNTNDYGVMLMVIMPAPRTDSLYHYNAAQNRLEARFTVEYPNKEKIPWHGYSEYPRHFIGDVSVPIQVSENTWSGSKPAKYIIDKKTLHGSYFRLYNDFLGTKKDADMALIRPWLLCCQHGTCPAKRNTGKEITRKDIPAEAKKRAQTLINSLDEEGNNVILLAKMKK